MGWFILDGADGENDHEGYLQGVVRDDWGWRDLGLDDVGTLASHEFRVQVACTCGWRTERMLPPLGAEWAPCSVFLSEEADEEAAREVWLTEHRQHATSSHRRFPR